MTTILAKALINAANIRESSFDKKAANEATGNFIDYSKFYTKSLREACIEANSELEEPVYLLLYYCWNDALDWANAVLNNK